MEKTPERSSGLENDDNTASERPLSHESDQNPHPTSRNEDEKYPPTREVILIMTALMVAAFLVALVSSVLSSSLLAVF
jgi:hypothetical protein